MNFDKCKIPIVGPGRRRSHREDGTLRCVARRRDGAQCERPVGRYALALCPRHWGMHRRVLAADASRLEARAERARRNPMCQVCGRTGKRDHETIGTFSLLGRTVKAHRACVERARRKIKRRYADLTRFLRDLVLIEEGEET